MNEIITKALKEQLRVLNIFLSEYRKELDGEILTSDEYLDLNETSSSILEIITDRYKI